MTLQIARSTIASLPYDYLAEVEKFRQSKLAHRFTGEAAPSAPAIIEQALRRVQADNKPDEFELDIEIIEDVPVPTIEDRRALLMGRLHQAEQAALLAIISPAAERLLQLDVSDAQSKAAEDQTPADIAVLARFADINAARKAIIRHFANQQLALEGLGEADFDAFQIAPFQLKGS